MTQPLPQPPPRPPMRPPAPRPPRPPRPPQPLTHAAAYLVVVSVLVALLAAGLAVVTVDLLDRFFVWLARLFEDISTQGPQTESSLTHDDLVQVFVTTAVVTLIVQILVGGGALFLYRLSVSIRAWPAVGQALLAWVTALAAVLALGTLLVIVASVV